MKNMDFLRKLPTPKEIKALYPLREDLEQIKLKNDEEIQNVFTGKSDKFIIIIGPCSADREDSVLEYMHRLRKLEQQVNDVLVIIPRLYTNKPRTTGEGYKGMLHQPNPLSHPDMLKGVISIRKLHIKVLEETGFTCADEMLYPDNYRYLSDILSYSAVGARSVENQEHRLTASGLDIPVGMKNPTSGDFNVMMNSIKAAHSPHTFIYRGWEVNSKGNDLTHAILRGYVDKQGRNHPNYHFEDLILVSRKYKEAGLKNQAVIVDCNHANSNKQWFEQIRIAKEILHSTRHNEEIRSLVKGLMIESYLEDGCQKPEGMEYGKSITDPCLGWEKTEQLILDIAEARRKEQE